MGCTRSRGSRGFQCFVCSPRPGEPGRYPTQIMNNKHQREGSKSNSHVGREFEATARRILDSRGLILTPDHSVEVGVSNFTKSHEFDLGSENPATIVECKSHKWTAGNNVPSAKMTTWNEAMYYFHCAPEKYRKIFFVLKDPRRSTGETLAEYYVRTYLHFIPDGVEIFEYDSVDDIVRELHDVG